MNIKFPKDETLLLEKIKTLHASKDYSSLIMEYNNIINNCLFISKHFSQGLDLLVEALFKTRNFEKLITCVEEFKKKDLENCSWYFLAFISLVVENDIYYAKRIINKSVLLNDSAIKFYIYDEGADYYQILRLHKDLLYSIGPCLIIINFINDLIEENTKSEINKEYILMRLFDLLNLLYESNADDYIIKLFRECIEILYEIEIA